MSIDYTACPSPAFVLEEARLRKNLELLQQVEQEAGVSIILALKAFAMWQMFPLVGQYLSGATASSLHEARLIFEEMGVKAHTYSPAYIPSELDALLGYSSHITFNSIKQYQAHRAQLAAFPHKVSPGIRVNPEFSTVKTDLYNPAMPGSRLGEMIDAFAGELPAGIEGLHFHTLCESGAEDLEQLLTAFEQRFGHFVPQLKWVNFGGGHLITRKGYNVPLLIELLRDFRTRYGVEVILEPGSAVAWGTGVLVASVLDIMESGGIKTAILDVSFTAHMPDTLEMPYRPEIEGASDPVEGLPRYRLGGISCLAGDYLEEYSFKNELQVGDRVILKDMMHYTMVKTNHFNGVSHPSICRWSEDGHLEVIKTFTYTDYRDRLS